MNVYTAIGVGILKILVIVLIILFTTRKYVLLRRDFNFLLDCIIRKYFEYLSLLIVILFITINLEIYDGLVVTGLLVVVGLCDYLRIVNPIKLPSIIVSKFKKRLLLVLKKVENKEFNWKVIFSNAHLKIERKNVYIISSLLFLLFSICVISFYFIKFDHYLFSSNWFDTLERIKAKDNNRWFTEEVNPEAVYAFVSFLSHITNSSLEISIYVYSIFQLLSMTIVVFWFIQKITKSMIIIPIFVTVYYILGFTFLPSDITNFYQSCSLLLAFTLILPLVIYMTKLRMLPYTRKEQYFKFLLAFIAIGLLDLYAFLFLLPFLVIFLVIVYFKKNKSSVVFQMYVLSLIIVVSVYSSFLLIHQESFNDILRRTLIDVQLSFSNPFIRIEIDRLMFYYQIIFIIGFILNLLSAIFLKRGWRKKVLVFLFVTAVYLLTQVDNEWIDKDVLFKVLSVFIPILMGINIAIVSDFLKMFSKKRYPIYKGGFVVLFSISIFVYLEKNVLFLPMNETEKLHQNILAVNEMILRGYLDRTYAVVNKDEYFNLSSGRRYFIPYKDFLAPHYLKVDSIYAKNIKRNKFLIKHPEFILPSSIFVFKYTTSEYEELNAELLDRFKRLKKRNRNIKKIFDSNQLEVYEIINKPFSSKISNMVF
ncbi:hypothetical protein B0A78_03015 [Flavobacterium columnare NBRC 100251 = ATCC 23463]|uniref:hypothetical protein n=2 Tax=Flavobacterium columnare TaxID=996 RepID=UPI0007F9E52C|nr:hypothetical protein [Flavobacterium columnare]ANO47565.1 hypothetical protein Pf1_02110 [Flavobacterium columnare]APT21802.1 hypothetical protein BU993_03630 [Flavobacterium columnare]MBF6651384.1 hypothetical protein [Flavobacterium columnare]MBF6655036.1 hypothetical protein [Flavobacterium columnare]MBF6658262.1 hypothetical protein [Flavobacterium columnare]